MHADVIVVGGGLMGCSIAYRLAKDGARVLVLERSIPGAEASSAAAGILGPTVESFGTRWRLSSGAEAESFMPSSRMSSTSSLAWTWGFGVVES